MTITEIETIEHLDFDFDEPCENEAKKCSRVATWVATMACCGTVMLVCDDCKKWHLGEVLKAGDYLIICVFCRNDVTVADHVLSWEPL